MKNIYHSFLPSTKYKRFCSLLICVTIVQGTLQATVTTNTSPLYNIQKKVFYCEAGCTIGEWDNNDIIRCDNRTLFLR